MSQNGLPKPDPEMEALASMLMARGVSADGVMHSPPKYIPRIHVPGSLKEPSTKKTKFKMPKARFTHRQLHATYVDHKRFPYKNLLHTGHKTAKLHALNRVRREKLFGVMKKKTVRKPAPKSGRKSRRSTWVNK
jgi:hypothetical protein